MNILYNLYDVYNYMDAHVVDGLKSLGHRVFGVNGIASSYAEPHNGENYDLYFHSGRRRGSPNQASVPADLQDVPRIFIWGHDSGIAREPEQFPTLEGFDAYFVKDLRRRTADNVFPLHHGIEERFYCETGVTRLLLRDRPIDVLFVGSYEDKLYGHRRPILESIQQELGTDYSVVIREFEFSDPDDIWTPTMGGDVKHYSDYFALLAQAKVILCPMGATPDQLKRWEALASGAVVLAQWMPIVHIEPWLRNRTDYFWFVGIDDCIYTIREILNDPEMAQNVADNGFEVGREHHTTKARAQYILQTLTNLGLIEA